MYEIRLTPRFSKWLNDLRDRPTQVRLKKRLDQASRGLLGDVKTVGDGVSELRLHFGPGYRMYFTKQKDVLIIMLGGGDKSSQLEDIAAAITYAKEFS